MKKVLLLAPVSGNGGIQSWAKAYISSFKSEKFVLQHEYIDSLRTNHNAGFVERAVLGLIDLARLHFKLRKILPGAGFDIVHKTTSGSLGTLNDYVIGKLCKRNGAKLILHCHYGCIASDFRGKGPLGMLLRSTFNLYDQIWVLDSTSEKALNADCRLSGKIHLTPNPIAVPDEVDLTPKGYDSIGFIANILPSKGVLELIRAIRVADADVNLTIVGPGAPKDVQMMEMEAGDLLGTRVRYLGPKSNREAVEIMKGVDVLALPTYYRYEAFPISILEAMSRGKLVLSTPRAAIPDMLTALDGAMCGMLVSERSAEEIADAISWIRTNRMDADEMCRKAYEKVKTVYDNKVVYGLYEKLYDTL